MAYSCSTGGSFGPFCDEVNITETSIINKCLPKLNGGPKNGIVFELDEHRKKHEICWANFYDWIYRLCDGDTPLCALPTFKVYVEKKILKFKWNKQRSKIQSLIEALEQEIDEKSEVTEQMEKEHHSLHQKKEKS